MKTRWTNLKPIKQDHTIENTTETYQTQTQVADRVQLKHWHLGDAEDDYILARVH